MPAPATVHRDDVGAAAWYALQRDGVVRALSGDVAIRADLAESPELRAAALERLVPRRAVVGRRTAAWVHLGGAPPERVELVFEPGRRRTDPDPLRLAVEAHVGPDEVMRLGPVRVTTVHRTGLDLARFLPSDEALPLLRQLADVGFEPRRALTELDGLGGRRGVRQARDTLATLLDAPAP
jgi:hypothetical protein